MNTIEKRRLGGVYPRLAMVASAFALVWVGATASAAPDDKPAAATTWTVPPCSDDAWRTNAVKDAIRPLISRAQNFAKDPIPPWDEAAYTEFSRTGRREAGERMLLARMQPLAAWTMVECHENQGKWLAQIDGLLAGLAAQPTWTLPAHDKELANLKGNYSVDLSACELAHDIAWSLRLLGDRLKPATRQAMTDALEKRIFKPMRDALATRDAGKPLMAHWWLDSPSNWNAVCTGGVTGAAVTLGHPDAARWRKEAPRIVRSYLGSVLADGYSDEGPSYWNYGYGQYLRLRETLLAADPTGLDIGRTQRALALARYAGRIDMAPDVPALFGDAKPGVGLNPVIRAHADAMLGRVDPTDWSRMARRALGGTRLNEAVWRLWGSPRAAVREAAAGYERCTLFPDSGVAVFRPVQTDTKGMAVSFRLGGSQAHAHDDAASYAITLGDVYIAGDIGAPTYTAETFGPKRRENRIINSWGHPVPRVAEALQKDATKFRANWLRPPCADPDPDGELAVIDLTGMYDVPALQKVQRQFDYSRKPGEGLVVMDTFQAGSPIRFESAFISSVAPVMGDKGFTVQRDGRTLRVRVAASVPWELVHERNTSDAANNFSRVAIRLKQPAAQGCIALQLLGEATAGATDEPLAEAACAITP